MHDRLRLTPPPPAPSSNGHAPAPEANDPAATPRPPLLVDSREAARLLGVSERTLWSLADAGEIRPVHIGRAKRYAVEELQRFIRQRMEGGRDEHRRPER